MVTGPEITSEGHKVRGEGLKQIIGCQSIAAVKFKPSTIRDSSVLFKIKKTKKSTTNLSPKARDIADLQ